MTEYRRSIYEVDAIWNYPFMSIEAVHSIQLSGSEGEVLFKDIKNDTTNIWSWAQQQKLTKSHVNPLPWSLHYRLSICLTKR